MTSPPRALLATLAVLLLSSSAVAQASSSQVAGLAVGDQLSLAGSGNLTIGGAGAVHFHGSSPPEAMSFQADEITLEYAWEEGYQAGAPGQEGFYETTTDQGRVSKQFTNVTLSVDAFQSQAEILAYPNGGDPRIQASGTGGQSFGPLEAQYLTRTGFPEDGESTNDSSLMGFWYQPPSGWTSGHGGDEVRVQSDFSLFLNNLTVAVQEGRETVWENWTGHREENTGPGATSFERHLLKVHVTNGTLALAEDDALSVFGPVLDVQADGIVTAETATGQLDLEEAVFAFDGEPLRMEGEGRLQLRESSTEPSSGLALSVEEGSHFDVQGGQRVDPGLDASGGIAGWKLWAPVSLLGLALAGVVAHRTGHANQMLESWRSRRYTKWMTRGRELANAADYDAAAPCFRRATRAQPVKGVAWYHLAIALLEDGRPREVLDVVDEAREGEAIIDELDFLDLEAQAARRAGEMDRCRAAVARLADGSEAMATTLVRDLGLSEEALGHELATRLSWEEDEGALPGYV